MTTERDFDRLARAWLEIGPDEAPDRVIAAVLQAAEATPQVRRRLRWPLWRSFRMTRLPIIAATAVAVLVAVIGGGFFLSRSTTPAGIAGPSPSPTAAASAPASSTSSPAASSGGALPDALVSKWVGAPRTVSGVVHSDRFRFELTADELFFPYDNVAVTPQLASSVSVPAPGRLQLVTVDSTGGCAPGDTGTYDWSLSPGGTILTLTWQADTCATRGLALSGSWFRVGCKNVDSGCLGELEAGTHTSQYITPRLPDGGSWAPQWGALTYTVPAGWANSIDWPDSYSLTPSADYATEGPTGPPNDTFHEIDVFRLPAAAAQDPGCTGSPITSVKPTVDGLIAYIQGLKSVVSTAPVPITVDGHAGRSIDVKVAPTWTTTCPGSPNGQADAVLLSLRNADGPSALTVGGSERQRLTFVDLGGGQVVLILIDSSDPARFADLATQAAPIVSSFTFK